MRCAPRLTSAGLLPHVEPCAPDCHSAHARSHGRCLEAGARPLCFLLEHTPWIERARVAGKVLFVSAWAASGVGSAALYGVEPGARGTGDPSGGLAVV